MTTEAHGRMHEPEEPHDVSRPMPHHHVPYVTIFIILVALTVVTVAVAFIHIESEIAKVLLALLIASIKGACVAMFFMHLKFEGKLIYLIAGVPLVLTVLLVAALIPDVVMTDHDSHSASLHLVNPPPRAVE